MNSIAADVAQTAHDVRSMWGWYLTLGIALIALGAYAIYAESAATIASVVVLGIVLMLAGVVQIISGFMARGAGHVILLLLIGVLDIVVGLMLIEHPNAGALTVTLLLAALFVFGGIYRFVAALWLQFPQYGWVAASGVVSTVLGVLLWAQWPNSASWFIGFAVGVNLIFAGVAWSALALKLKSVTA